MIKTRIRDTLTLTNRGLDSSQKSPNNRTYKGTLIHPNHGWVQFKTETLMEYVVKKGDSLSSIARDVLGDISLWPLLAEVNHVSNPYIIFPGQVLNLEVAAKEYATESKGASASSKSPANKSKFLIIIIAIIMISLVVIFYVKRYPLKLQ